MLVTKSYREIDRPDESWKYPYVAAVLDFGSNLGVSVAKDSSRAVGFSITPQVHISHQNVTVLGFLAEFCENHGIDPTLREKKTTNRLEINRRDEIHTLLLLVEPYVIARAEPVEILLKELLPAFENGKHSDREGFLQMMEYVDQVREHTTQRGTPKYDTEYFREEWGM